MFRFLKSPAIDAIIFGSISVFFLRHSWQKWADPIWDIGRELYIPLRITCGDVLYKDLAFLHGALPPYINALVFKIFGPSLLTLSLFNLLITLVMFLLIYRLFYSIFDRLTALMSGIVFLCLFVFNQYTMTHNMYYITPYSHSYFYALLFGFCSLNILYSFFRNPRAVKIFSLGLCLGFMLLSRLEIFLTFIPPVIAGLWIYFKNSKSNSPAILRALLIVFLGTLLPVLIFTIYFMQYFPFSLTLKQIVGYNPQWKNVGTIYLYQLLGGYLNWKINLKMLGLMCLIYTLVYFTLHMMCYALNLCRQLSRRLTGLSLLFISTLLLTIFTYNLPFKFAHEIFRGQFMLILFLLIISIKILVSTNTKAAHLNALIGFTLSGWSLLMLWKVPLLSVHHFYGFIYCLPGILTSTAFICHTIPRKFDLKFGRGRITSIILGLMILIVCAATSTDSWKWIALKSKPLGSGPNKLWAFEHPLPFAPGADVERFLKWASDHLRNDDTYVTFPEGIMLNFLTGHKITGKHTTFMSSEMTTYGEEALLTNLKENPPDYFILVNRDLRIYGNPVVGKNYGNKIIEWAMNNYSEVWQTGQNFPNFGSGISVFKRNTQ